MKHRPRIISAGIFLGIGFAYFIWLKLTGLAIPCMFRTITGWLCPGCGITTLIMNLSNLQFEAAYHANPFLFVTGPLLAAELIYYGLRRRRGLTLPRWNNCCAILYAVALCIFGIIRNLPLPT